MYYKVMMEGGHMGAGKSCDMTRYFRADNLLTVFDLLGKMPRLKSKGVSKSVKQIKEITEAEYRIGKHAESEDSYLFRH